MDNNGKIMIFFLKKSQFNLPHFQFFTLQQIGEISGLFAPTGATSAQPGTRLHNFHRQKHPLNWCLVIFA